MKNFKTTLAGCLMAAATAITLIVQQGHDVTDWKTWLMPAAMAILGFVAKDYNATGTGSGPTPPKS